MKIKKKVNTSPREMVEHIQFATWLDEKGIVYFHPANGEKRHIATAMKLKRMGVKPGVPDFVILSLPKFPKNLTLPELFNYWRVQKETGINTVVGIGIEMKRQNGGTQSSSQKEWQKKFEENGWIYYLAKGAVKAKEFMTEIGY